MRVSISQAEHGLKKNHAGSPDACRPAKPGENDFRDERLNQEKQESAEKNRDDEGETHPGRHGWDRRGLHADPI
jgi:hypothetical protein